MTEAEAPNLRYEPLMKRIQKLTTDEKWSLLQFLCVHFMSSPEFWDANESFLGNEFSTTASK